MRTHEQIVADCEARFEELQREKERRDNDPLIQRPCKTCRWSIKTRCKEPLVKGFDNYTPPNVDWQLKLGTLSNNWPTVKLCGLEKALWQPVPKPLTRWQKFMSLFK